MPELPEVESARVLCEKHIVGATIVSVEFNEDGTYDEKIFKEIDESMFTSALKGRIVKAARRLGKHLWWDLGTRSTPLFHFGMTGAMTIKGGGSIVKYKAFAVDMVNWPPRFAKLVVTFSNGVTLAYTDPRRFGRVRLVDGVVTESPPLSDLGFDPLLAMPDEKTFASLFAKRAAPVKAVLLDQKVAAGVGNWVADEVLFHARVHPEQPAKSLTHGQLAMVRDAMSMVVTVACEAGAISEKFPEDWLFHHRWGKVTGNKVGGKAISFIEVGGRTTAFVPSVQKKTSVNAKAPPVAKEKKMKQTAKRPAAAAAAAKTAAAKPAAKRPRRTRTAAIVKLACVF